MRRLQHADVQRIREHHHGGGAQRGLRHWSMIIFTSQLLQLAERRRRVRHAQDHHHVDRAGETVERLHNIGAPDRKLRRNKHLRRGHLRLAHFAAQQIKQRDIAPMAGLRHQVIVTR